MPVITLATKLKGQILTAPDLTLSLPHTTQHTLITELTGKVAITLSAFPFRLLSTIAINSKQGVMPLACDQRTAQSQLMRK